MENLIKHLKSEWYKYGIETLVVIIGILVAFALNNWNENNKAIKSTIDLLSNLQSEFEENLVDVDRAILLQTRSFEATRHLYQLIEKYDYSNKNLLDSLIGWTMMDVTFNANSGALQDLLNSDKRNLIKSKELRKNLTFWSGLIVDLEEDQQRQRDFGTNVYFPFLSQNVAIRDLTQYLSIKEMGRNSDLFMTNSKVHETNYEQLLAERKFENLLEQRNLIGQVALIEMKDIRLDILRILKLIREEAK